MKFVIISPRQDGGGSIVLHALCKNLSELGHNAKIFYITTVDDKLSLVFWAKWCVRIFRDTMKIMLSKTKMFAQKYPGFGYVPVRGCKRKYLPMVDDDTIVVYPEIIHGNMLKAKNVVRWLLYYNRYKDDESAYGEKDLFISYRTVFNDEQLNPLGRIVTIYHYDLETYRQYNFGDRKGNCYIIRKGKNRPDLPKEFDGPIIDDLSEKEIVEVFNCCEWCISYDTQTSYSDIAALCGCMSIVIPEPGKGRGDYLSPEEESYGVAYGFSEEEIQYAQETRHKVKELFEAQNRASREAARQFAEICEDYFAKR